MSERKTGLHKGVEAIFKGVRIPRGDDAQQAAPAPAPVQKAAEETSPASAAKPTGLPKTPAPQPPPHVPAAPSHMTPNKPKPQPMLQPKVQQPAQPAPKSAPSTKRTSSAALQASKKLFADKVWMPVKNKFLTPKEGVSTSRQKTMVILVPVLFVVFIVILAATLGGPSGRKSAKDQFNPSNRLSGAADGDGIAWQRPAMYPQNLRDPMRFGSISTVENAEQEPDKLVVKGILFSEDNPSAVIGDQIVHQGEKVANITIVKINSDSVEFELDGKKWTQNVQK
jgi:hypothetical protein